jgi:hypothetical protein
MGWCLGRPSPNLLYICTPNPSGNTVYNFALQHGIEPSPTLPPATVAPSARGTWRPRRHFRSMHRRPGPMRHCLSKPAPCRPRSGCATASSGLCATTGHRAPQPWPTLPAQLVSSCAPPPRSARAPPPATGRNHLGPRHRHSSGPSLVTLTCNASPAPAPTRPTPSSWLLSLQLSASTRPQSPRPSARSRPPLLPPVIVLQSPRRWPDRSSPWRKSRPPPERPPPRVLLLSSQMSWPPSRLLLWLPVIGPSPLTLLPRRHGMRSSPSSSRLLL